LGEVELEFVEQRPEEAVFLDEKLDDHHKVTLSDQRTPRIVLALTSDRWYFPRQHFVASAAANRQSTMNSVAPTSVDERWGSALSATW
jgi:hypothetical protein